MITLLLEKLFNLLRLELWQDHMNYIYTITKAVLMLAYREQLPGSALYSAHYMSMVVH